MTPHWVSYLSTLRKRLGLALGPLGGTGKQPDRAERPLPLFAGPESAFVVTTPLQNQLVGY